MYKTNPDRNAIIYEQWEKGNTVSEIHLRTGIPRSTVGYYVRKFNKYAKDGRPVVLPQKREAGKSNVLVSATKKWFAFDTIIDMLKSGEVEKLYYLLSVIKLIKELGDQILFTQEENKAFFEALLTKS
ncbi:hypothetical protein KAS14_03800 [Candidatus Bathyarchaeota archaeon]|nr:hypothetical protein [Candidatus Bathyarchaeota archaeon]